MYLEARGELESQHISDLENDEEINTLIEEKVQQAGKPITDTDDSDFSASDDFPLSLIKRKAAEKI